MDLEKLKFTAEKNSSLNLPKIDNKLNLTREGLVEYLYGDTKDVSDLELLKKYNSCINKIEIGEYIDREERKLEKSKIDEGIKKIKIEKEERELSESEVEMLRIKLKLVEIAYKHRDVYVKQKVVVNGYNKKWLLNPIFFEWLKKENDEILRQKKIVDDLVKQQNSGEFSLLQNVLLKLVKNKQMFLSEITEGLDENKVKLAIYELEQEDIVEYDRIHENIKIIYK